MSSPSSSSLSIVTITILSPSATSHAQPISNNAGVPIPVASIVGGCLAGIIIAVAAVVGWHLWGRSIKRKEEVRRKEVTAHHATQRNTKLNAFASLPSSYTPSFRKHTQDRKVKFSTQASSNRSDRAGQFPAVHYPTRPSPLSQSKVIVDQPTV
ncbi:hypothetical protein BJ322DRAFT_1028307 [Thelephora terrestris]|uniref:Uncharacterized protein n=1 Tax=Thelephora terrestris TaxID=56493 RepID=A0A9P6HPA7_9AGAM|nr:hypothetical protein BJ322DRAFT_1028307 [Thelephora terrestris]